MTTSHLKSQIFKFCRLIPVACLLLSAACGRKKEASPVDLGPAPTLTHYVLKNLLSEFPGEIQAADYAGQVQLVLFFRTDDPACRGSIADWNQLHKDFADRGLVLVGAVVDDRPPDLIAAEALALGTAFPVGLVDDPRLIDAFGGPAAIRAIPTAFLLSRDGDLLRTYAGYEPLDDLRDDISRALDGHELIDRNPPPAPLEDTDP